MNIPDEAIEAAYDALCAIYWPDTQTYDVATADLDTVSETVYTVLEAAIPHIQAAYADEWMWRGQQLMDDMPDVTSGLSGVRDRLREDASRLFYAAKLIKTQGDTHVDS